MGHLNQMRRALGTKLSISSWSNERDDFSEALSLVEYEISHPVHKLIETKALEDLR